MATASSIPVAFRIVDSWDIHTLDVEPHQPRVLRSDDEVRVVAVNLPAGEALDDHQVHERAYVLVVDGEAQIVPVDGPQQAGPGFLAHFEPNERHEVRAKSDTRLVLFLAPWPGVGHPSQR
jgi:quercetin dioxygenase-like cupin family protein